MIMPPAASGPAPPSAKQDREGGGGPRAQVRDVPADEGDGRDRPDQRDAKDRGAERHDHRVEPRDDGDAEEVSAEGSERSPADDVRDGPRDAEVPFGPVPDLGPVAEEEEQAEDRQREEEGEPGKGADAVRDAVLELRERRADRGGRVLVCLGGGRRVDADVFEPALEGASGVARAGCRCRPPREVMPPITIRNRPTPTAIRPSMMKMAARGRGIRWPFIQRDERRGDRGHNRGRDHRRDDRLRERGQPHEADQEQGNADQEPRRQADVPQPRRCREDTGELARVDLDVVAFDRAFGRGRVSLGVASPQASPDSHPGEPKRRLRTAHHPARVNLGSVSSKPAACAQATASAREETPSLR